MVSRPTLWRICTAQEPGYLVLRTFQYRKAFCSLFSIFCVVSMYQLRIWKFVEAIRPQQPSESSHVRVTYQGQGPSGTGHDPVEV